MLTLYVATLGLAAFVTSVAALGLWLRRHPTRANAEKASRVLHFFFYAGLVAPTTLCIFYPGLTHMDALVGLSPLPWKPLFLALGILLLLPGLALMAASNRSLRALGSGANAFVLTRRIVETDIYRFTRNPMSLGYYLISLGVAFIAGSTLGTLAVLLGLVPAHLFFLKFFEEVELDLRFDESYREYKRSVPFLVPRRPRS